MTNEEKILEILSVIQKDISGLKVDVSELKVDVSELKADVSGLKEEQQNTNKRLGNLEKDVSGLKEGQTRLENCQAEQHDILKALLHNQEFANAKIEAIEITTAKADALIKLDSKVELINTRLFNQEAEIRTLKVVNN